MDFLTKSIKLFSFKGIETRIHFTFLFFAIVAFNVYLISYEEFINYITIIGIVFGSVIVHEYGHALTAKHLGYDINVIYLSPIGGIATSNKPNAKLDFHENWRHEFNITLNGPLVNLVFAAVASNLMFFGFHNDFIETFFVINAVILVFNLLPVYPMDGGRIARSLLTWYTKNPILSTKIAASLSLVVLLIVFPTIAFYTGAVMLAVIGLVLAVNNVAELTLNKTSKLQKIYSEFLDAKFSNLPDDELSKVHRRIADRIAHACSKNEKLDFFDYITKLNQYLRELVNKTEEEKIMFLELYDKVKDNAPNKYIDEFLNQYIFKDA